MPQLTSPAHNSTATQTSPPHGFHQYSMQQSAHSQVHSPPLFPYLPNIFIASFRWTVIDHRLPRPSGRPFPLPGFCRCLLERKWRQNWSRMIHLWWRSFHLVWFQWYYTLSVCSWKSLAPRGHSNAAWSPNLAGGNVAARLVCSCSDAMMNCWWSHERSLARCFDHRLEHRQCIADWDSFAGTSFTACS